MKNTTCFFLLIIGILLFSCKSKTTGLSEKESKIAEKVDSVLDLMTLEEKIGQLNMVPVDFGKGPSEISEKQTIEDIKKGHVGSLINCVGIKNIYEFQKIVINQSRLKIPMIFGFDVIHGYRTIFPVPLAEAASWDLEAIEKSARIAATETAASGLTWTFAPMVDIARDPRWGRMMEGAGEDPYLGSLVAKARIHGFQGDNLSAVNTVLASAKHFAAYGYVEAGREYNSVNVSTRVLREVILPPFKAAADAGVATFMTAFSDFDGSPASGSEFLVKQILKKDWKFNGFVVSDWGSIGEMMDHGVAKDKYEAAQIAMNAEVDMDIASKSYIENLEKLVKDGKIKESQIDNAVRRILHLKFLLGLFDNPYLYCDETREKETIMKPEFLEAAKDIAKKSIVLLKNEKELLPLKKEIKTIAVIGELANSKKDMLGNWTGMGQATDCVTLLEGLKNKVGKNTKVLYSRGYTIYGDTTKYINEAVNMANQADVVILAIGEKGEMSGESNSRTKLGFIGSQEALIQAIKKTGKPVVALVMSGRPLIMKHIHDNFQGVLYTWFLGTKAGDAMADVLFGDYNPSAKLPVTFPLSEGQIPIYYSFKNTGRPVLKDGVKVVRSAYIDSPNEPLYVFGYGLSYTNFEYSEITLDKKEMTTTDSIKVSINVKNTGKYDGEEVIQLYIRDNVASVTRPLKELKGFKKTLIKAGESQTITFFIKNEMLKFYDITMNYTSEPGDFMVFIGTNSKDVKEAKFRLN